MNIPARRLRIAGTLLSSTLALGALPPAGAQEVHVHAHAGSAVAQMKLDDGRKWATDASLRSGMSAIRKAFDADHPAIHAAKEANEQYDALASQIEAQVNDIVKNCHLPAAADANLHFVIADLLQGVSLMRGTDPGRSRHDGAALVHGALIAYGKYFEDPDWVG